MDDEIEDEVAEPSLSHSSWLCDVRVPAASRHVGANVGLHLLVTVRSMGDTAQVSKEGQGQPMISQPCHTNGVRTVPHGVKY